MLDELTLAPASFGAAHVEPVRAAGMDDEAIADAIAICALFSMIDRCADALGFALPESFEPSRLLAMGYLPR
jgi:alkylhydroperoxidase family enzyme